MRSQAKRFSERRQSSQRDLERPNPRPARRAGVLPRESLPVAPALLRDYLRSRPGRTNGQNFDWGGLLEGMLDAGSAFGDYVYPGAGMASKAGKLIYKAVSKPKSAVKKVEKAIESKVERKIEAKEAKETGAYTGTRSAHNLVRKARIRPMRDMTLIDGCDVIQNITTGASGVVEGQVLATVRLNPLSAGATQLKSACSKYEMWRPIRMHFHCPGGAGTTVSGTIISFTDRDADDIPMTGSGSENVRLALTHTGAKAHTLWGGIDVAIPCKENSVEKLYVSDAQTERRFTDFGTFYLVAGQNIAANVTVGPLFLDWELALFVRSDEQEGPTGDFFRFTNLTGAGIGTTAQLGAQTACSLSASGTAPVSVNYDIGAITLPAGHWVIDTLVAGTGLAYTTSLIQIEAPGVTSTSENYYLGSSTLLGGHLWCSSPSQFVVKPNVLTGMTTCTGLKIMVMAVSKSPYGLSLRELKRSLDLANQAADKTALLARIREENPTAPVSIDFRDEYVHVPSGSSTSSSTSGTMRIISSSQQPIRRA